MCSRIADYLLNVFLVIMTFSKSSNPGSQNSLVIKQAYSTNSLRSRANIQLLCDLFGLHDIFLSGSVGISPFICAGSVLLSFLAFLFDVQVTIISKQYLMRPQVNNL